MCAEPARIQANRRHLRSVGRDNRLNGDELRTAKKLCMAQLVHRQRHKRTHCRHHNQPARRNRREAIALQRTDLYE